MHTISINLHISSLTEHINQTLINTENTGMFSLTGHPTLSLNIGKVLPEDVSKIDKGPTYVWVVLT